MGQLAATMSQPLFERLKEGLQAVVPDMSVEIAEAVQFNCQIFFVP